MPNRRGTARGSIIVSRSGIGGQSAVGHDRRLNRAQRIIGETLPVECWCRARVVDVPVAEVRAILTRSCGARKCTPEVMGSTG